MPEPPSTPLESRPPTAPPGLEKAPSGIPGFDEITDGGLPRGRTTLVCGAAGAGKTLFGMQFLVNGILAHDEPGVFLAFEETERDLVQNAASLGFDLEALADAGKLSMDHVRIDRSEIAENGEYNLEGLFLRLNLAIESIGAKRVVIDTLETLFGGLDNYAILRSELKRLIRWLKDRGVTAVVTAERGDSTLTRHGLEEYVSDCVILLDHRVTDQISTRRLRIVKYRGSSHGTNEFPFLIEETGITVMPITSAGLNHEVSNERVSTGVERLDAMLGGGYYRGSTVLVSGTAGAGKSSLAAHFADAVCRRGERCLLFSFEESPAQFTRNMASIGLDLARHRESGLLRFMAARPTAHGLEVHLASMHKEVRDFAPGAVIIDPISNLSAAGGDSDNAQLMVVRLVDYLKTRGITSLVTTLTAGGAAEGATEMGVSSIMDTWLLVKSVELGGERNRLPYVLKSRGMAHSTRVYELVITSGGVELVDVYVGPEGMLTGSARADQESRAREAAVLHDREAEQRRRDLERRRAALEGQIMALRAELEAEEAEMSRLLSEGRGAQRGAEPD